MTRADSWGERVWRNDDEVAVVLADLDQALNLLDKYRTNLDRGWPLLGGEGAPL